MSTLSEVIDNEYGVPQGSQLGPILYIIYINDIVYEIGRLGLKCKLFADDTKIYFASKSLNEIERKLNDGLLKLTYWLKSKQLKVNVKKTVFMLLHDEKKKDCEHICKIMMNNERINEVSSTKYLGVIIDNKLNF